MINHFHNARLLIVDDHRPNVAVLQQLLKHSGYQNLTATTDPREVLSLFLSVRPDLVLLDLHMPHLDGYAVLQQLKPSGGNLNGDFVPVLVLTADTTSRARQKALSLGGNDFVTKPFESTEVLLRVNNLLQMRFLHLELKEQNESLEERVRERTTDLCEAVGGLEEAKSALRLSQEETVQRLAIAAEFRDNETARHIERMSHYCELLARSMGESDERCQLIRLASQMHDVGKIGTPDQILLKPGKLTSEERVVMERHAEIGYRILARSKSQLLQLAASIALTHHERIDGGGYPQNLTDDEIPVEGRIAAIADVFDALTSDRVYRKALPLEQALQIMQDESRTHLDPMLLDLFLEDLPALLQIKEGHPDAGHEKLIYESTAAEPPADLVNPVMGDSGNGQLPESPMASSS